MPKHTSTVEWQQGMSFDVELNGHHFAIDADGQFGGEDRGPRPKALLLSALGGCTGMDVVSILNKMRMKWDSFSVAVDGDLTEEHPKHYNKINIVYTFTGPDLDQTKIEKAVKLSQDSYCGVSAMLNKAATITHEIVLNP